LWVFIGLSVFFFFSSRRRHTRWPRDWSSDVCSSDLSAVSPAPDTADGRCHLTVANLRTMAHRSHEWPSTLAQLRLAFASAAFQRSEERRVGKEWRTRWSAVQ